nr:EOG090X0IKC [Cyclestheria hislopi]
MNNCLPRLSNKLNITFLLAKMVSTKRSKSRKKFRYNVNRKRANKRAQKLPAVKCKPIKEAWNPKLTTKKNITKMGLVYDVNSSIPLKTTLPEEPAESKTTKVIEKLKEEANAPRKGTMKISAEQIRWIEYFLDKYGEDYEAMARDKENHYQETASQLKQKIQKFLNRPAYSVPYFRKRGLILLL